MTILLLSALDNQNISSGVTQASPKAPSLNSKKLLGSEFIELSLPADSILTLKSDFKIRDNHAVIIKKEGAIIANSIAGLNYAESVEGSGGGYLY